MSVYQLCPIFCVVGIGIDEKYTTNLVFGGDAVRQGVNSQTINLVFRQCTASCFRLKALELLRRGRIIKTLGVRRKPNAQQSHKYSSQQSIHHYEILTTQDSLAQRRLFGNQFARLPQPRESLNRDEMSGIKRDTHA